TITKDVEPATSDGGLFSGPAFILITVRVTAGARVCFADFRHRRGRTRHGPSTRARHRDAEFGDVYCRVLHRVRGAGRGGNDPGAVHAAVLQHSHARCGG